MTDEMSEAGREGPIGVPGPAGVAFSPQVRSEVERALGELRTQVHQRPNPAGERRAANLASVGALCAVLSGAAMTVAVAVSGRWSAVGAGLVGALGVALFMAAAFVTIAGLRAAGRVGLEEAAGICDEHATLEEGSLVPTPEQDMARRLAQEIRAYSETRK